MIFTEFKFIFFFIFLHLIYWFVLKGRSARKFCLLVASYLFYAFWDWRFLGLLITCTLANYFIGQLIHKGKLDRKSLLILSIVFNCGLLGFFKYFNFFVNSAVYFFELLGLPGSYHSLKIILPVGISFYTFKVMSYCIEIYRGNLKPNAKLFDFALFVAFFPQLFAGPIDRASHFIPQINQKKSLSTIETRLGLNLFIIGFIKKAIVSDNISPVVDQVFGSVGEFGVLASSIAVILYAIQIYCDFSGYSDMANGVTRMLGYKIVDNFSYPYFSTNIAIFWRRWHITLSYWFRDYVYIPLGGNRGGNLFVYRNLMLTMLLCGLWHGAGWNFVFWGGLHGLALVVHRIWANSTKNIISKSILLRALWQVISCLATFYFVCIGWIFFRSDSLNDSLLMSQRFITLNGGGEENISIYWLLYLVFIFVEYAAYLFMKKRKYGDFLLPNWAYSVFIGVLASIILLFLPLEDRPFIYFQF